ncbi:MAG: COG1361 S-layer family protein [Candidatus Methanoperedens sp.]|nr:COG1361 S-layer family protein [Candidatus Methanoperedens sp.]
MKRTILQVFIILALLVSVPAVYAGIGDVIDATVISISVSNYEPDPAIAGDIVEVRLGVSNIGTDIVSDLMVEVMPEYPFVLVPGESAVRSAGILQGYKPDSTENINIIKYRMQVDKNAPAGRYELKVKYYEKGGTSSTPKSLSLDVKSKQSAEVIHIDKTILVPGKQTGLKFTINNVGNAPLRDLTFYWENGDNIILPVGSDNTRYLKYIDVGEGADLDYQVISDTNTIPGLYKLNLYLTYEDPVSKTEKKISTIAGVYVGGGTDFDVAFSESANGETSFSIANIGSNPAYSVSVIIPEQRNWRVTGSNSVIIGNLNKGDYTVASFKLQSSTSTITSQNRTAPAGANIQERSAQRSMNSSINGSSDTLLMQIAYTDTMGERNIIEKEVKVVGVQSTAVTDGLTAMQGRRGAVQQEGVSYIWYLIGIAVLVVGFVAYRKYRSQKLIDPDFNIKDLIKIIKK